MTYRFQTLLLLTVLCSFCIKQAQASEEKEKAAITAEAPQLIAVEFVNREYFREETLLEMMSHATHAPLSESLLQADAKHIQSELHKCHFGRVGLSSPSDTIRRGHAHATRPNLNRPVLHCLNQQAGSNHGLRQSMSLR